MIKAIETQYKGYRFRSRLEARWAVFFDVLGITWEYEHEGYELSDGTRYLPDFWLPGFDNKHGLYVEVKPDDKDLGKAMCFVRDSKHPVLFAIGMPEPRTYEMYGLVLQDGTTVWDGDHPYSTWNCFHGKYLPGGCNADEYRLYVSPGNQEAADQPLVRKASYAAKSARFEFGESGPRAQISKELVVSRARNTSAYGPIGSRENDEFHAELFRGWK